MVKTEQTIESENESCSVMSNSLWPHGLHSPWNSPGQNTGAGSLFLLQGIFRTQEFKQGLLHFRRILYQLSYAAAAAKSLQSCLTLCDPIDGSPPGSLVLGILQARTLERVAISFSNAGKWKVKGKSLSRVWLLATPWTTAYQAPLSMGFSRQEYWSGVPLPSLTELWGKPKQNHYGIEKNKSTWQSWSWNMEILVFSCKVTVLWPRDPAWGRVQVPINSCFPGSQEVPLMVRLIRLVIMSFFTNSKETILYWVSLWSCISQ